MTNIPTRSLLAFCVLLLCLDLGGASIRPQTGPVRTGLKVQSPGHSSKRVAEFTSNLWWSTGISQNRTIEAKIDTYLRKASAEQGFSGVVLVWRKRNLLNKGYGWEDRGKTQPLTKESKFYFASISKQFAAAAILKLEEQGRLSVNDPIGKFFKNVPPDKAGITIHHLLTHTSGLPQGYAADGLTDRDEAVAAILRQPLSSQPGEKFGYTNDGYNLVAAIVEIVSGTFESFLRETLLAPVKMKNTGFWGDEVKHEKPIAHTVTDIDPAVQKKNWGFRGATGMFGTAEDLYNWQEALFAHKVLSKEGTAKLLRPYTKTSRGEYAYGWFRSRTKTGLGQTWTAGSEGFGHNGIIKRYDDGSVVVVLSNSGNISGRPSRDLIVEGVEEILFGGDPREPFVRINPMPSSGFSYTYYLYVSNNFRDVSGVGKTQPLFIYLGDQDHNDSVTFGAVTGLRTRI